MEEVNNKTEQRTGYDSEWISKVSRRKAVLEKLIMDREASINSSPEGHLRVQDRNSYALYYWIKKTGDTNGELIPKKNRDIARKLAQKDYDKKLARVIKKELKEITKYLECIKENDISSIYEGLSDKRKLLVKPLITSDEEYIKRWKEKPYDPMGFDEGSAEYYSDSGIRVRSKSEIIIANMLEKYGVPYKYECPLKLGKRGIVSPDFTCLNIRTRKEYIWEHFGMMDDENYANKNVAKINSYEESGYQLGKNMIMTFEASQQPINSNIIKNMITSWLL
ncbi:hypothetical protein [Butyrivibrio sp. AE3006]|uniref:hypothetical protein n=1 Tax=Butyrivibrio sp. AE3006 TaxID=1280673 RepID=UPI00042A820A|nr:hypothetical protein [Butyrivibrio sp. AE3006]